MSRHSEVLRKAGRESSTPHSPNELATRSGEYSGLIERLFRGPGVLAIVGGGSGEAITCVCDGIAAQLAALGKRVVIIPLAAPPRLDLASAADNATLVPGSSPKVCRWPRLHNQPTDFFKSHESADTSAWLNSLRLRFDSVLLDCPLMEAKPSGVDVVALADAAVLVVEAGRTSKRQVERDQRALQERGVRLVGSVLIRQR